MTRRSLRILIIDESSVRAAILEEGLRLASGGEEGGTVEVHHIRDTVNLLARISAVDPDVILIDLENPSRDVLEQMFQVSRAVKRPVAMFVDQSDSASIQAAVDAGVSAYIVDGLKKERISPILETCISRFRAFARLQDELDLGQTVASKKKYEDELQHWQERIGFLTRSVQDTALLLDVAMQSGMVANQARILVLPEPEALYRRGLFPQELNAVAIKMARGESVEGESIDPEKLAELDEALDTLVCDAVREIRPDAESAWQPLRLKPADLRDLPGDAAALRALVQHEARPKMVTAISRYNRGQLTADEVAAVHREQMGRLASDWASFRQLATGLAGVGDGGPLRPTPIDAHRPQPGQRRPRRRARAG